MRRSWIPAVLCGLAAASAFADVKMPAVFSDNMVLQRDFAVPVWGWAKPGEKVTVSFAGQTKDAVADASGKWKVELDKLAAAKAPAEMTVKGENEIKLKNILVGEVWLCSGQSNMEWTLGRALNGKQEAAEAKYPNIRLFQVPRVWNNAPQADVRTAWQLCEPEAAERFSAVGYFFGRELMKELDVPVGLINASWGGTRIEPWTAPSGFQAVPVLGSIARRLAECTPGSPENKALTASTLAGYSKWLDEAKAAAAAGKPIPKAPDFPKGLRPISEDGANHQQPTVLYNAMIAPYVPYALRGAIWYQGEANLSEGMLYRDKMSALIQSWRKEFNNPEMPLYFAQLAPYIYNKDGRGNSFALPGIWQAQERFAKEDKFAGMAVINDVGNLRDIHPTNKQVVGKRLALHALKKNYGKNVKCESPTFKSVTFEDGKATVTFDNAESLITRDGKAPDWFELAGGDGVFKKAVAEISGNTVIVRNAEVGTPAIIRFAWNENAEPNLRNEAGLQVGAFKFGEISVRGAFDKYVADGAKFKVVFALDPLAKHGDEVNYLVNDAAQISGKIKRIGYFLNTVNAKEESQFVFVAMDPFTADLRKIGVPTKKSGARFQEFVKNLEVASNVASVKTGKFEQGNIEFWDSNYGPANAKNIPGASGDKYDFGDKPEGASPGYGSMQVHNTAEKQTVFAYNQWKADKECDLGIGNQPSNHPDWTFSKSGRNYKSAQLLVLVEME